MACSSCSCDCVIIAGAGVTVTGVGTDNDPVIVSVADGTHLDVEDTDCIEMNLEGSGTAADPWIICAEPIINPDPNNLLQCSSDGLQVLCEDVQDAVGALVSDGCGLIYDDDANTLSVEVSEDPLNDIVCRPKDHEFPGLFATCDCSNSAGCGLVENAGALDVVTGPGLDCDDTAGVFARLGCGLVFDGFDRIAVDTPTPVSRASQQRAELIDIPCGTSFRTGQVLLTFNNQNCSDDLGWVSLSWNVNVRYDPGTDFHAILELSLDGGAFVDFVELTREFVPAAAGGTGYIHGAQGDRVFDFSVPANTTRILQARIRIEATPAGDPDLGGQGCVSLEHISHTLAGVGILRPARPV